MRDKLSNQESNYFQTVEYISTEKALRSLIPNYPKMLDKRIQSSLDFFSLEFIGVAKIAFLASNSDTGKILAIDVNNDINLKNNTHFTFKKLLTFGQNNSRSLNASIYFMAPGVGHGLRINGTLSNDEQCTDITTSTFNIEAVYFHCARAAARAELWKQFEPNKITEDNIIQHSPFLLLKTMNAQGKTELSPRGDEPGFVKIVSEKIILLPERPGNKIAVSLRNIIICPDIEIIFLVPNSTKDLNIKAKAKIISDKTLLEQCTVKGKTPKTGILIQIESSQFSSDFTFDECDMWNHKNTLESSNVEKNSITSFSKALSAHINGTGLLGKATNAVVSTVVKHDMKNLY